MSRARAPLDPGALAALRWLVAQYGLERAAAPIGRSRNAVDNARAGRSVHAATREAVARVLGGGA